MFLKEVTSFLDDGPLGDGALATEAPPIASMAMLHRFKGFAVVWRLLNANRTLELRLTSIGRLATSNDTADAAMGVDDTEALADEVSKRLPLLINFNAPVVPNVHFFEQQETGVFLLCTADGTIHRFSFPQGLLFYSDLAGASWRGEYQVEYFSGRIRTCHPVAFHALDLSTFVIACNDGTLVHVENSDERDSLGVAFEHAMSPERKGSGLNLSAPLQWLGLGKNEGSSADGNETNNSYSTQALDMAGIVCEHSDQKFLMTVCRDWKLRVWSLRDHRCVITVPLEANHPSNADIRNLKFIPEPLPPRVRTLIRIFDRNLVNTEDGLDTSSTRRGYSFKAVIHCPFENVAYFTMYEGHLDTDGRWRSLDKLLQIEGSRTGAAGSPTSLVDFAVTLDSFAFPEAVNRQADDIDAHSDGDAWTLWILGTREREVEIAYTKFGGDAWIDGSQAPSGAIDATSWVHVLRTSSNWLELPDFNSSQIGPRSVSDVFLQHIFYPNRFSPVAIVQALRDCERSGTARRSQHAASFADTLSGTTGYNADLFKSELLSSLEGDADTAMAFTGPFPSIQDLSDNAELLKLRWTKFLNACIQNQLLLNTPLSLQIDSDYFHATFIMRLGAISTLRGCEELDVLDHVCTGDLEEPLQQEGFLTRFPFTTYQDTLTPHFWEDFIIYLDAMEILYEALPAYAFAAVEQDVIAALRDAESLNPLNFAAEVVNRYGIGTGPGHAMIEGAPLYLSKLAACHDLESFLERVLELLRGVSSDLDIAPQTEAEGGAAELIPSRSLGFGFSVLAVQQIAESRHRTCWNLAITLMLLAALDQRELVLPKAKVASFLSKCFETLRVWILVRWLCRETASGKQKATLENDSVSGAYDFTRSVWDSDSSISPSANKFAEQTLIDVVMSSTSGAPVFSAAPLTHELLSWAWDFLVRIGFCQSGVGSDEDSPDYSSATRRAFVSCALYLRDKGLLDALDKFIPLMPNDVTSAYIHACLLLEQGQAEKAGGYFKKTAAAFVDYNISDPNESTLLRMVLPKEALQGGSLSFYTHVMDLFSAHGNAEMALAFARSALEHVDEIDERMRTKASSAIWHTVFLRSLDLLRYDDAYDALFSGIDGETRRTCLERFVTVLSENQQGQRLCKYQFRDMQDELEYSLRFKAGNAQAFERPNYSEVLYAYYISRKDYRSAASTMYRYAAKVHAAGPGNNLRTRSRSSPLAEICQSLSCAIHALSALKQEDAWFIATPIEPLSKTVKKRRLLGGVELGEKEQEAIRLEDVRRYFVLASSKMLLANQDPQYSTSTISLEARSTNSLLVTNGLINSSIAVCHGYDLTYRAVLESMVDEVVKLANFAKSSDRQAPLDFNPVDCSLSSEGTAVERAWKALQVYLAKVEGLENADGKRSLETRCFVIDKILAFDQSLSLPPWLIAPLKARNFEDLVRLYLKHDMLMEACQLAIEGISNGLAADRSRARLDSASRWIPYNLANQLISAVDQNGSNANDRLGVVRRELGTKLKEALARATEDSDI